MKKLKMFGFAFALMLAGMFSASALEFGGSIDTTNGKLSYTKEANEGFAYQFVKITGAQFTPVKAETVKAISDLETAVNNFTAAEAKVQKLEEAGITSGDEYVAACDEAADASVKVLDAMDALNAVVSSVANYDDAKWIDVTGTQTSGELDVDVTGLQDDDVYVLWIKDVDTDMIMLGEIFTNDGVIDVPAVDDNKVDNATNNVTPTKTATTVKNPKTGINLPIAAGVVVIALAGAVIGLICKQRLSKQI